MSGWRDPALARALARWQHAAGPFWPYVCAAPFLGQLARPARGPGRPGPGLVGTIERLVVPDGTALFVDLPPGGTLPLAPRLNRLGLFVAPAFERWAVSPAVLRCERLLAALVAVGERVARPPAPRGLVVLLDGERAGPPGLSPNPRTFDNRYAYVTRPFPPPALLAQEGITQVCWLAVQGIAPDLESYAAQLAAVGLSPRLA